MENVSRMDRVEVACDSYRARHGLRDGILVSEEERSEEEGSEEEGIEEEIYEELIEETDEDEEGHGEDGGEHGEGSEERD